MKAILRSITAMLAATLIAGCASVPSTKEEFTKYYKESGEACAQYCTTGKATSQCTYYHGGRYARLVEVTEVPNPRSYSCEIAREHLKKSNPKEEILRYAALKCFHGSYGRDCIHALADLNRESPERLNDTLSDTLITAINGGEDICKSTPRSLDSSDVSWTCEKTAELLEKSLLSNKEERIRKVRERGCLLGSVPACNDLGLAKERTEEIVSQAKAKDKEERDRYTSELRESTRQIQESSRLEIAAALQNAATGLANAANTYANRKNPTALAATSDGINSSSSGQIGLPDDDKRAGQLKACIASQCSALENECKDKKGQLACYKAAACACGCGVSVVPAGDPRRAQYAQCQSENNILAGKLYDPNIPTISPSK